MASSLLNLANNLAEGIQKINCKLGHDNGKCETCGIKYKNYECCLEYINQLYKLKDNLILFKKYKFNKYKFNTSILYYTILQ